MNMFLDKMLEIGGEIPKTKNKKEYDKVIKKANRFYNKHVNSFVEFLGILYLDFDNESKEYRDVVTREIKDKLKEL